MVARYSLQAAIARAEVISLQKVWTIGTMPYRLKASQLGPIPETDVEFGDLTIFVGLQASGKSVFLQTLKLGSGPIKSLAGGGGH
jgi:hypothetical protein